MKDSLRSLDHVEQPVLSTEAGTVEAALGLDSSLFDRVYLGNPFCLRAEGNILASPEEAAMAVDEAKSMGMEAYLSTPAVMSGADERIVMSAVGAAVEAGADGFEVTDVGLLRAITRRFTGSQVALGALANVYSRRTAEVFADLGVDRFHASPELSLEEIIDLASGFLVEVSVFGWVPLGVSSHCILAGGSRLDDGGNCTQGCVTPRRLEFEDWSMVSVGVTTLGGRRLSMLAHASKLISSGLSSWRIHGLYEQSEIVNAVGRLFRQSGDAGQVQRDDLSDLLGDQVCNGWFFGRPGRDYVGTGTEHG